MNPIFRYTITSFAISILIFASTAEAGSEIEDKGAFFEGKRNELQSWNPTKGFPKTLAQAGLTGKVELFDSSTYGDGGSIYWIVKDEKNNYFAFWKEPETKWNEELKATTNQKWNERKFWIGTTHPGYYPTGLEVPAGSDCERFLNQLIRNF